LVGRTNATHFRSDPGRVRTAPLRFCVGAAAGGLAAGRVLCDRDDRFVVGKRHCREFALGGALQGQELPVCPLWVPTVRARSESVDAIW
jgi:hypothetical protein